MLQPIIILGLLSLALVHAVMAWDDNPVYYIPAGLFVMMSVIFSGISL